MDFKEIAAKVIANNDNLAKFSEVRVAGIIKAALNEIKDELSNDDSDRLLVRSFGVFNKKTINKGNETVTRITFKPAQKK